MPKSVEVNKGQRQSQWKLMKDAALCNDPQSVISKILEQHQRGNSAISFFFDFIVFIPHSTRTLNL